ncbi:hypothetical protein [Bifidobacterium hapali]|uniref:hypothetical protein n=1 Tax=Bifidobacterium hapali TaxID=1630172 RepID=UPI001177C92C|nr:hypothetical protein [Bifidobacterium hapali]
MELTRYNPSRDRNKTHVSTLSQKTGPAKSSDSDGDSRKPGYSAGLDWNEFHTRAEWNQTG